MSVWHAMAVIATATVVCHADTVTFSPAEVDLGQGAGIGSFGPVTTEWAAFGFTMTDVVLYRDLRDWGPDYNGVTPTSAAGGNLLFNVPVNDLSVRWASVVNRPYGIIAYDEIGQELESFSYPANGLAFLGETFFTVDGIASLRFFDDGGFVSISEMSFSVVPLPTGALMGCAGLVGVLGVTRLRRR